MNKLCRSSVTWTIREMIREFCCYADPPLSITRATLIHCGRTIQGLTQLSNPLPSHKPLLLCILCPSNSFFKVDTYDQGCQKVLKLLLLVICLGKEDFSFYLVALKCIFAHDAQITIVLYIQTVVVTRDMSVQWNSTADISFSLLSFAEIGISHMEMKLSLLKTKQVISNYTKCWLAGLSWIKGKQKKIRKKKKCLHRS